MSEATDPVNVIYQLKRAMQNQMDALVQTIANGGVDSMEEYKYIIGKIHGIDNLNQELSNLLEPKEPKNDTERSENVVDFGRPEN